jgi:hypothetical protein
MHLGLIFVSIIPILALSILEISYGRDNPPLFQQYQSLKLGISFEYPIDWKQPFEPYEDCRGTNNCMVTFMLVKSYPNKTFDDFHIYVMAINLDLPFAQSPPCNCNSLKDFLRWRYDSKWKDDIFINDNQTKIADNKSAWQIELKNKQNGPRYLEVLTVNGNYGYVFFYSDNRNGPFGKYLDGFHKILDTARFTTVEQERKPSFLANTDNQSRGIINKSNRSDVDLPSINRVKILSTNSFTDSSNFLHIVGQVQNNTPLGVEFVRLTATLYDSNNKVVGTQFSYTNPSDIPAGEIAPFEIIVTSASIPVSQIDHYRVIVGYQ